MTNAGMTIHGPGWADQPQCAPHTMMQREYMGMRPQLSRSQSMLFASMAKQATKAGLRHDVHPQAAVQAWVQQLMSSLPTLQHLGLQHSTLEILDRLNIQGFASS